MYVLFIIQMRGRCTYYLLQDLIKEYENHHTSKMRNKGFLRGKKHLLGKLSRKLYYDRSMARSKCRIDKALRPKGSRKTL
jgi:hypothetical protein